MFYCATSKEVIYYELQGLNKGDEIILSYWKTTDRLFFNSVGYTQAVLDSLGAKRNNPFSALEGDAFKGHQKITFNPNALTDEALKEVYSKDENSDVRQAFSQAFVQDVSDKHDHQYKLSTAIGKLHFGSINGGEFEISGIMYPTTRMWGNGDNIAIKPFAVDDSLQITMATHVRIDDRSDTSFSITAIDSAISFDKDGKLNWLGRLPNWTLHNQGDGVTVTLTAGRDKYGEYSYNKDGIASYWDVRDMRTGEIVESS